MKELSSGIFRLCNLWKARVSLKRADTTSYKFTLIVTKLWLYYSPQAVLARRRNLDMNATEEEEEEDENKENIAPKGSIREREKKKKMKTRKTLRPRAASEKGRRRRR
jgi:hypothetical protein